MSDQERDPVAYAHCQEAGRVPGPQTANDADLEEYLKSIGGRRASALARAIREREEGPW